MFHDFRALNFVDQHFTDQLLQSQEWGKGPLSTFFTFWIQILRRFQKMTLENNLMGALVKIWQNMSKFGCISQKIRVLTNSSHFP